MLTHKRPNKLSIQFTAILFLVATLSLTPLKAQDKRDPVEKRSNATAFPEDEIERLSNLILNSGSDQERLDSNRKLIQLLQDKLQKEQSFSYPFKEIESMGILSSPDSAIRLFNWSIPMNDGSYRYECFLLKRNDPAGHELIQLKSIRIDTLNQAFETFQGSTEQWPGALYYQMVQQETSNKTYYTLLAWDGHNRLTNRKWIETFWFDVNGKLKMGAAIFKKAGEKDILRPVFRFAAQHAMKMNYNSDQSRIEFDFLAPENPSLKGVYEYYFPDVTQDAYRWENGSWVFEKLIDNEKNSKREKKRIEKQKKEVILEDQPIYKSN